MMATSCGPRMDAINWYLRIEHTEECGNYALYGGEFQLLCPVEDAAWDGDSVIVKSGGSCYFLRASTYKDGQPIDTFPCAEYDHFIRRGIRYWSEGAGPKEVEQTIKF